MKKVIAILLVIICVTGTGCPVLAAKKKKKKKVYYYSSVYRTTARPVFPVDKASGKAEIIKPRSEEIVIKYKPLTTTEVIVKNRTKPRKGSQFVAEGGLGGGALAVEMLISLPLRDKIDYFGGLGYGIGSGYGVVIMDLARLVYSFNDDLTAGLGINYAMYSSLPASVPGLSTLTDKSLMGVELFGAKQFGRITARLGYSTALGFRLSAGYKF